MSLPTFLTLTTRRSYFLSLHGQVKASSTLPYPFSLVSLPFLYFCINKVLSPNTYCLLFFGERIKVVKEHSILLQLKTLLLSHLSCSHTAISFSWNFFLFFFPLRYLPISPYISPNSQGGIRILLPHPLISLSCGNMNYVYSLGLRHCSGIFPSLEYDMSWKLETDMSWIQVFSSSFPKFSGMYLQVKVI